MESLSNIITYLICSYIFILPILPSKYKYKNIPFNGDIVLLLIIILFIIFIFINGEWRKNFFNGIRDFFCKANTIFIFMWVGMMVVSISYSPDKKLALQETIRTSTYIVLFFIIKYEVYKKKYLDKIIYSYIFTSIIVGFIGIYEYLKGIGLTHKGEFSTVVRCVSTLENSNNLGGFFIMIVFPMMVLSFKEKQKCKRNVYILCSIIAIINIIISFSRNAWLAFVIGYMVLIIVFNFKLIYGAILGAGVSLFIPKISNRLREIGDVSQNLSRISLWKIAWEMVKDKPLLGVGNGNYRTLYPQYYKKVKYLGYTAQAKFHPHNAYLKAQCELGIIGLISLLGIFVSSVWKVNELSKKSNNTFYKYFYKGFIASLIAFMFMNFIDNFFSAPKVIAFFWISLAVADSFEYNCKS
ncbi:O-antigen ligase family protein [Clostridium botulinum]|uniref:O-antigen polymerase n=1 Tax=Clostridium botulinum (strain Hall / ATCC 3502 / NCTC 13319 / Type A) TaxID=441771 RepID=A5I6H9_CLOBH|nr:O-antigen ligase family protein [Clostridium botulinum]ABS35131.1 exopolysaccharide biosynthesis family protein [Clostridium botulinum A str. ATCC 19397]ABS37014.1 exopolysaccharide biosynthesis family protein [Clostridium botulinum A str. Hall]AWB18911.1 exopolysaccharide biosynthesis protein [Clostridium botulinum]AWB31725.1 exopolysaccharide biosynthesis protein [Clostridium botulinum]EGT5616351.1 O-antigen ligase family protein [Clostridium botulinum]